MKIVGIFLNFDFVLVNLDGTTCSPFWLLILSLPYLALSFFYISILLIPWLHIEFIGRRVEGWCLCEWEADGVSYVFEKNRNRNDTTQHDTKRCHNINRIYNKTLVEERKRKPPETRQFEDNKINTVPPSSLRLPLSFIITS